MDARLARLIHHIAGEHYGQAHFSDLDGQEKIALKGGGIDHIDHRERLLLDPRRGEHGPGDDFFLRVGGEGIGAGQVHHAHVYAVKRDETLFLVHGHAGIVAHMLMGAGVFVKRGGLAAVGVSGQRDADFLQMNGVGFPAVLTATGKISGGLRHASTSTMI